MKSIDSPHRVVMMAGTGHTGPNQAVNVLFNALKWITLTWKSMGMDELLKCASLPCLLHFSLMRNKPKCIL